MSTQIAAALAADRALPDYADKLPKWALQGIKLYNVYYNDAAVEADYSAAVPQQHVAALAEDAKHNTFCRLNYAGSGSMMHHRHGTSSYLPSMKQQPGRWGVACGRWHVRMIPACSALPRSTALRQTWRQQSVLQPLSSSLVPTAAVAAVVTLLGPATAAAHHQMVWRCPAGATAAAVVVEVRWQWTTAAGGAA